MAFGYIASEAAAALAAWACFSAVTRQLVKPTVAGINAIAELRPEGNRSKISELVANLPLLGDDDTDAGEFSVPLLGDENKLNDHGGSSRHYKLGRDMILSHSPKSTGLWGVPSKTQFLKDPSTTSLRDMVARTKHGRLETNYTQILKWMKIFSEITSRSGGSDTAFEPVNATTHYNFAFRDYHSGGEDVVSIMVNRGGIENLLLSYDYSQCVIHPDGSCQLQEKVSLLRFFPLIITWEGNLVEGNRKIDWYTSRVTFGWEKFWSKTVDKPAAAEKLRKANWKINLPPRGEMDDDCSNQNILVFEREGVGRLCYATPEMRS